MEQGDEVLLSILHDGDAGLYSSSADDDVRWNLRHPANDNAIRV